MLVLQLMKKTILILLSLICTISVNAQEIKGATITVLKGGITVMKFHDDIVNFRLGDKDDYYIN